MIVQSRVKVLHVIYSLYHGGAERLIEAIVRHRDTSVFEHIACSLTGGDAVADSIGAAGGRVILLEKRRSGDIAVITKLIGAIRREHIRIMHLHNSPGAVWGTLAAVLGGERVPIVRTEHSPYRPELFPMPYRFLYPLLLPRARRIICVSESVRESFVNSFPRFASRFRTIYNGIGTEALAELPPKEQCRSRFGLPADAPLAGTVGRLVPVKNHMNLLEAFSIVRRRLPDAHLAILGEGELEGLLRARAARLGISDGVSILTTTPDIGAFYGSLDCFVLSSDSEGLPLTLLEALAARVPAVATAVGGIPEVIDTGVNGHTVPKGSPGALAERITEVLQHPDSSAEMSRRGRETVLRRFDIRRCVDEIERLYIEVLGGEL
ncbi:MAG: glycosyltransferase [bacterium]|nr:MAG: glycosyltransferase [bacterium]